MNGAAALRACLHRHYHLRLQCPRAAAAADGKRTLITSSSAAHPPFQSRASCTAGLRRMPQAPRQQRQYHQDHKQKSFFDEAKDSFERAREALFDTKTIWKPIPISLGLAVIALLHLRRLKERADEEKKENPPIHPDLIVEGPLQIRMYAALPLREASRLWGWLNGLTVPTFLRTPLYKTYSYAFGCNLDEMLDEDLKSYPNLGEFFYRRLKDGVRPIDPVAALVSPADGKVLNFGVVQDRHIQQVKGITYSLDALLGRDGLRYDGTTRLLDNGASQHSTPLGSPLSSTSTLVHPEADPAAKSAPSVGRALHYCVIYLAPGDYHRFHSPADWNVDTLRHFAGELLSVSPMVVAKIRNLFVLNERVTLTGSWAYGFFSMIPVGATNVGSIRIDMAPELETNLPKELNPQPLGTYAEKHFGGKGRTLYRGQEVGGFRLGSTVVLVFEAPENFKFLLEEGQKLRVGQALGVVDKKGGL
ncbi:phosphatidylserine decarboxylase 1 [Dinochytrium kinnereticum]|nr:phosphatidylserine decarboxylase 1 [Dinochytrium kinnereticum]